MSNLNSVKQAKRRETETDRERERERERKRESYRVNKKSAKHMFFPAQRQTERKKKYQES